MKELDAVPEVRPAFEQEIVGRQALPGAGRAGDAIPLRSGYREGLPAMLFAMPAAMGISTVLPWYAVTIR